MDSAELKEFLAQLKERDEDSTSIKEQSVTATGETNAMEANVGEDNSENILALLATLKPIQDNLAKATSTDEEAGYDPLSNERVENQLQDPRELSFTQVSF